jgi:hypothetical protein
VLVLASSVVESGAQARYQLVRVPSPAFLELALLMDLNNDLQGVGIGNDLRAPTRDPRAYYADLRGAHLLPIEFPETIFINNRGMIAGTRRIGRGDDNARVAFLPIVPPSMLTSRCRSHQDSSWQPGD